MLPSNIYMSLIDVVMAIMKLYCSCIPLSHMHLINALSKSTKYMEPLFWLEIMRIFSLPVMTITGVIGLPVVSLNMGNVAKTDSSSNTCVFSHIALPVFYLLIVVVNSICNINNVGRIKIARDINTQNKHKI